MTNKTFKYLLILAMFSNFMVAEDTTKPEEENKAKEKQETFIEEMVEDYEEIPGFFTTYRDPETNQIYLKISEKQLEKEFIYFAHSLNSVVSLSLIHI